VTALYLLEPESPGAAWAPFTGVRPIAELRAGIWRIRERWEAAAGNDATAILGFHTEGFSEGDEPPVRLPATIEGPALIGAAWFAPSGAPIAAGPTIRRLTRREETVGWVVPQGERWTGPHENGPALEIAGLPLHGTYDLLTALESLLPTDCADFLLAPRDEVPEGSLVLGDPTHLVCLGAQVEPGVVFDLRQGAVVVDQGAEIRNGTRLEGPT